MFLYKHFPSIKNRKSPKLLVLGSHTHKLFRPFEKTSKTLVAVITKEGDGDNFFLKK